MNSREFPLVPIGEGVCRISTWNPRANPEPRLIDYVDLSAIDQSSKKIGAAARVEAASAPSRARQLVKQGDVLVSTVRPNLNGVAIVPPDLDGATASTGFSVLRADERRLSSRYLFHWVRGPQFVANMVRQASGQSYPAVSDRIVKSSLIPLPGIDEQRRIAAILDKADGVRRKREKALLLTDEFLHSAFLDMFGDPVANSRGWTQTPLGERLDFLTSGSRGWAKYYSDDGDLFLRIGNVGRSHLLTDDLQRIHAPATAEARRTRVRTGDVLLSITADLGRTAVIPEGLGRAYINQHLAILRASAFDPTYLSSFIASAGGQLQIQKMDRVGVKSGLNFDNVRSLLIMEPPRELQDHYSALWKRTQGLRCSIQTAIEEAQNLFNSLSQRAFRGEF